MIFLAKNREAAIYGARECWGSLGKILFDSMTFKCSGAMFGVSFKISVLYIC